MIDQDGDRREFFRTTLGRFAREMAERTERRVVVQRFFRPPGAQDEVTFLALCTRCDLCAEVCPPQAIAKALPSSGLAAGTPMIEPSRQPCTVCSGDGRVRSEREIEVEVPAGVLDVLEAPLTLCRGRARWAQLCLLPETAWP